MNEHLAIFLNNTTSNLKKKVNLNNFVKLLSDFDSFIIIDVNNDFSQNLKNEINQVNNNKNINFILKNELYSQNHSQNDFDIIKIKEILKNIKLLNSKYITFIHDNYIYTGSINDYLTYISNHELDFSSFLDSLNNYYEYIYNTFIFTIKNNDENIYSINSFINNPDFNINNFYKFFPVSMPYLKLAYLYNHNNKFDGNIFFNDIYEKLFIIGNIPIISIDKLIFLKNNYKYKYEIFKEIPYNFDVSIYKKSCPELINFNDNILEKHFLNTGQFLYKKYSKYKNYINYILPDYLRTELYNIDLLYLFDIPDNFNVFKYKENNLDLESLNETKLVLHWIDNGISENRIFI